MSAGWEWGVEPYDRDNLPPNVSFFSPIQRISNPRCFCVGTPLLCANPGTLCQFCRGFFSNKPRTETICSPDGVLTYPFQSPRENIRMMRITSPSRQPDPQARLSLEPKPQVRNESELPPPPAIGPRMTVTIVSFWILLMLSPLPMLIHYPRP